ncbi:MAG: APC family permease [Thermoplasmata archaeon]
MATEGSLGNQAQGGATGAGFVESDRKLRKELTFTQLLFLSVGAIIGSGWLFAVASPYGLGIAGPAVIISWIIGGIFVLIIAFTYAEVAGILPRTGGIVRYPNLTHGGYTGSILGWTYLLSAVTVPAIEAIAVITYASAYVPALLGPTVTTVLGTATILSGYGVLAAFALLVGFFFLNFFGVKLLGRFNQGMTWWKLIIPVITFLFLFTVLNASNFTASCASCGTSGFLPYGWPGVFEAVALAGIIFSYLGFRQALDYGGEAKVARHVPLATFVSVIIGIVVYVLLQVSFIGAINWQAAGIPVGDWNALSLSTYSAAPFYNALTNAPYAFLGAFASLLLVDAWISPAGTGWIYMGTSGRTFYGLSADSFFGRAFLPMNRWGIPWIAMIASVVVGTIFLVPFPSWYLLVGFITSATVFTYIMGGVVLHSFRRFIPTMHRPFHLPAGEIFAGVAFVAAALVVYWSTFSTVSVLEIAIYAGLVLFILIYAPLRLGMSQDLAYALGIVVLAILVTLAGFWYYSIVVPFTGGTLVGNALSNNFLVLLVGLGALGFGSSLVMYLAVGKEHRREIVSGVWVFVFMETLLALSFYGSFGYDTLSYLVFPWDIVAVVIASAILYFLAIGSAYKTPDLAEIEARQLGEIPSLPPGDTGAPPSGPSGAGTTGSH